jgi:D,D-heptose 1,7-bisphosphate phosphatase
MSLDMTPEVARPAVFVDRDGTLIRERDYLSDPAGVDLLPGVPEAIKALQVAGYLVVVVTNQSGIARGLYTLEDYRAVEERLDRVLAERGVVLDGTYFCPHHPEFTGPCRCRKPDTGMHLMAGEELKIVFVRSYYIGDRIKDVIPAEELGGSGILVRTGYGRDEEADVPPAALVVEDFREATAHILRQGAR